MALNKTELDIRISEILSATKDLNYAKKSHNKFQFLKLHTK